MAYPTIGSIATAAFQYVANVSAGTSGAVVDFASGASLDLGNIVNTALTEPFASKYQSILVMMTAKKMLEREIGIGANFSYSLDGFSVTKSGKNVPAAAQLEYLTEQIDKSIQGLGRHGVYARTY